MTNYFTISKKWSFSVSPLLPKLIIEWENWNMGMITSIQLCFKDPITSSYREQKIALFCETKKCLQSWSVCLTLQCYCSWLVVYFLFFAQVVNKTFIWWSKVECLTVIGQDNIGYWDLFSRAKYYPTRWSWVG